MTRLAITTAGLFSLSVGKVSRVPIPLPPLAEQYRIVAKVDELMALCDRLQVNLSTTEETRCRLFDALLAEALAPVEVREKAAQMKPTPGLRFPAAIRVDTHARRSPRRLQ